MPFCQFEWTENQERKTRRVLSLRIQDRRGTLFTLAGDRLPLFISLDTGNSASAKGVAEILLSIGRFQIWWRPVPGRLPEICSTSCSDSD